MKGHPSLQHGCIFGLSSILLAFVITLGTTLAQRSNDPACGNNLSAGFPLPFLCDSTGGSPISSWGRIDWFELLGIKWRVFLLDFLLYGALCTIFWIIVTSIHHNDLIQNGLLGWGVLLCLSYILVFLFAFAAFQADRLNFDRPFPRTPTPIVYSPTPPGTMPPPQTNPTTNP